MENEKYEEYVYVGKEIPADINIGKTQRIRNTLGFYPPRFGLKVGEYTEEFGRKSFFLSDTSAEGPTILDRLIDAGIPEEHTYDVFKTVEEDGKETKKVVSCTSYFLIYEHKDATFRRPTATESIINALNVNVSATVEIHFATEDMWHWDRYITMQLKTACPAVSMIDIVSELPQDIRELVRKGKRGFSYAIPEERGPRAPISVVFFNDVGHDCALEFDSLNDLMRTIVSIRLIDVNNHVVKRGEESDEDDSDVDPLPYDFDIGAGDFDDDDFDDDDFDDGFDDDE